jgi:hypothetical protein
MVRAACGVSFVIASAYPSLVYPLMSFGNLVLTIVLVRVWVPKQDIERIHARRAAFRGRARQWLHGSRTP